MFFESKNLFEILKEAEEDEANSATGQNDIEQNQEEAPSPEESADNAEDQEDDYGSEDDFNIDTTLDEEDQAEDQGDDPNVDIGDSDDSGSSSTDSMSDEGEEEANPANTDIFSSLSAEEQQIKIKELKNLYVEMYSSLDDMLNKLNSAETNEDNLGIISRLSTSMYSLKQYIADYLTTMFAHKSYIENDIMFNRFLSTLNSIKNVLEDLIKQQNVK